MKDRTFFLLTGFIFGAVALTHLLRVLFAWPLVIGSWSVPMWVSWLATIVAAVLCLGAFRKGMRKGPKPNAL